MYSYKVPDMSCDHCVAAITKAVRNVDASADVKADLSAGKVTVRTDAPSSRIEDALREAGYPAEQAAA